VIRSILAVIAGYAALVLGVGVFLAFLMFSFPGAFPSEPGPYTGPAWILLLELAFSGLVAGRAELKHALVLVGLMTVLGVVSALFEAGLKPLWSSLAMPVVGGLGVLMGAKLRQRHRERRALER
jgi:hypothetical protein